MQVADYTKAVIKAKGSLSGFLEKLRAASNGDASHAESRAVGLFMLPRFAKLVFGLPACVFRFLHAIPQQGPSEKWKR